MGGEVATFTCGTCGSLTAGTAWCGNARNGRGKSISTRWRSPVVLVADSVAPVELVIARADTVDECPNCEARSTAQFHHVHAVARGGTDTSTKLRSRV